jgi:zinc/manganese transport system substrate-binding protein
MPHFATAARFASAVLVTAAGAGPARAAEPLFVVTTIETLADLAQRVGGDQVTVRSLSHGYQDPHFVEAKPNLIVTLNKADLLIRVGLELEIGWLPPLVQGARNERIGPGQPGDLDVSNFIEVLDVPTERVTRAMGDIHPLGNPHFWIPPENAVRIAKGIADRMKQLRPADAAAFDAGFANFLADMKAKATGWEAAARPLAGLKVVAYHRSWTYLERWLKLDEVGEVENKPGIPPSPSHLAELMAMMPRRGAKAILVEDFYNRAIAEEVAERTRAKMLLMPSDVGAKPSIKSYFDLVDAVLAQLNSAR